MAINKISIVPAGGGSETVADIGVKEDNIEWNGITFENHTQKKSTYESLGHVFVVDSDNSANAIATEKDANWVSTVPNWKVFKDTIGNATSVNINLKYNEGQSVIGITGDTTAKIIEQPTDDTTKSPTISCDLNSTGDVMTIRGNIYNITSENATKGQIYIPSKSFTIKSVTCDGYLNNQGSTKDNNEVEKITNILFSKITNEQFIGNVYINGSNYLPIGTIMAHDVNGIRTFHLYFDSDKLSTTSLSLTFSGTVVLHNK